MFTQTVRIPTSVWWRFWRVKKIVNESIKLFSERNENLGKYKKILNELEQKKMPINLKVQEVKLHKYLLVEEEDKQYNLIVKNIKNILQNIIDDIEYDHYLNQK